MAARCIYNPLDKFYKNVTGAVREQQNIVLRIKGDFEKVDFVCHKDGENPFYLPMKEAGYLNYPLLFPLDFTFIVLTFITALL